MYRPKRSNDSANCVVVYDSFQCLFFYIWGYICLQRNDSSGCTSFFYYSVSNSERICGPAAFAERIFPNLFPALTTSVLL